MSEFAYQFAWDGGESGGKPYQAWGVDFDLAATVFRDKLALTIYDEDHSDDEER